jgi:ribosome-associated protein
MREFKLNSEYIELIKLLKIIGIAETGGHAKLLVDDQQVLVNGQTELRKRAKLRTGDLIEIFEEKIKIV